MAARDIRVVAHHKSGSALGEPAGAVDTNEPKRRKIAHVLQSRGESR
jgi:hypothetical protein